MLQATERNERTRWAKVGSLLKIKSAKELFFYEDIALYQINFLFNQEMIFFSWNIYTIVFLMGQFSFSLDFSLKTFDARMNIIRPGKIAHPIGRAWARKSFQTRSTFQGRTLCLVNNKKHIQVLVELVNQWKSCGEF